MKKRIFDFGVKRESAEIGRDTAKVSRDIGIILIVFALICLVGFFWAMWEKL